MFYFGFGNSFYSSSLFGNCFSMVLGVHTVASIFRAVSLHFAYILLCSGAREFIAIHNVWLQ